MNMEQLPTVGDLVRFKVTCLPPSYIIARALKIFLVSHDDGYYVRLHGEDGLVARDNFDIVSRANENR
jgi:hypothetical protein